MVGASVGGGYDLVARLVASRLGAHIPGNPSIVVQNIPNAGGLVMAIKRTLEERGIDTGYVVTSGNETGLNGADYIDYFAADPNTKVIVSYLESVRDPDAFLAACRRARDAGKPVVVYKLGRSQVGVELANSHTGAMTGSDDRADAFFRAHGMLRVDLLETLFELPPMIMGKKPRKTHRVAIMSTTGGGAATVADRLGTLNIDVIDRAAADGEKVVAHRLSGAYVNVNTIEDLNQASFLCRSLHFDHHRTSVVIPAWNEEAAIGRLLVRELRAAPDYPAGDLQALNRRYTRLLTDLLREGIEAGEIAPGLESAALCGVTVTFGWLQSRLVGGSGSLSKTSSVAAPSVPSSRLMPVQSHPAAPASRNCDDHS